MALPVAAATWSPRHPARDSAPLQPRIQRVLNDARLPLPRISPRQISFVAATPAVADIADLPFHSGPTQSARAGALSCGPSLVGPSLVDPSQPALAEPGDAVEQARPTALVRYVARFGQLCGSGGSG